MFDSRECMTREGEPRKSFDTEEEALPHAYKLKKRKKRTEYERPLFYIDRKTNINYIHSECITHFETFL